MRVLLMEADDTDAIAWQLRYSAACDSLGLPLDVVISRVGSLAEGRALLETGDRFDMVVVSPELPEIGAYATEALEAVRRVAPDAAVQVYAASGGRALEDQIATDPFASLALKRPTGGERDRELEALIQEAYRRGKQAIAALDRQVTPLVERSRYLEQELDETKADVARQLQQLRQDMQRSQDAVLLATVDVPDVKRAVGRLEKQLERFEELRQDVAAIRRSLGLLGRAASFLVQRWQWIAGLAAAGGVAPLVVRAVVQLLGES
ncbi:MAG: hypothetical protein ACFB4J_10420 [Elainellaceae cyanobacterium]